MINKIREELLFSLLIVPAIVCLWFFDISIAQSKTRLSSKNHNDSNLKLLLQEVKKVEEATKSARHAVEAFADSSFLPELLFNLSEWELRRAKLHFNLQMEKYDYKIQLFEKDSTKYREPEEPILNYQPTLDINHRILREYSDVKFYDKVLYRNAVCLYETGQRDSAKTLFLKLASQYSDSTYIPEIIFRIGECYFDNGQFDEALKTYNQILKICDSPFFAMALYKRAWCFYRLNDYPHAISTFFYLLNDIKLMEDLDSEILGKSQVELRSETIDYIGICFTDFGGVDMMLSFINDIGGSDYTPQILQRMAEFYFNRDFFEEAIYANNLLLKFFPLYEDAPQVQYNTFKCFEKLGDMDKAMIIRNAIVRQYGPNSAWAKQYSDHENYEKVSEIIKSVNFVLATPYINQADSLFTVKKYELSIQAYKNFLKAFPKDERADHAAYYLAESLYESKNYNAAAIAYCYVTTNFSNSQLREDAAFNRIICYDNLNLEENSTDSDSLIWNQSGKFYEIILPSKNQRNIILACKDFVNWFPKTEKATEIQLKLVEIFMRLDQYKLSERLLNSVLVAIIKYKRGIQYYAKALNLMAQANFKQEDFRDAEKWYTLLIKENPDSAELIEKSKTMLASASFKVAEALKDDGNTNKAALKFEKAATEAKDVKVAEAALFEAAVQFEKAGKSQRAAINFEIFCKKYPYSENYEQALYHAALLREKLFQWYMAADIYMALYHRNPRSSKGASALFNAGINFENAKDWFSMAQTFNEFVQKFPDQEDKLFEAMFKVGYAYEQSGKNFQAEQMYQKIVDGYSHRMERGLLADDYFAAEARFRMGEIKHKEFSAIRLEPPFQQHLKKKQLAFNKMLEHCVEVAKYNVAEWTTAAFYNIGHAYEEFCQDILNSPAPSGLTKDQLQEYWDMVHQKWVLPLQAEALKYYQSNLKLAFDNKVENDWTTKTKDRVSYLTKKLATYNGAIDDNVKKAIDTVDRDVKTKKRNL